MSNDSKSQAPVTPATHGAPPRHDEGVLIEAHEKGGETVPNSPAHGAPQRHVARPSEEGGATKMAHAPGLRRSGSAHECAQARTSASDPSDSSGNELVSTPEITSECADPRTRARLTICRNGDFEYIVVDGRPFGRDISVGRLVGLARPRDVRRRIALLIERGVIDDKSLVVWDAGDGAQSYYLDSNAAMKVAFRSNTGAAEDVVMRVAKTFMENENEAADGLVSVEKALIGYQRTLAFIAKKTTPDPARRAALPALEKYARAAGLPLPDLAELMPASPQPRLPGV